MSRFALALLVSLCCSFVSAETVAPARAQSAAVQGEARRLFMSGIQAAEEERWGDALELFRSSRERVPRASTSYNIGNVLMRLGRVVEARAVLRDYLEESEGDRSESSRRARAQASLGEIADLIATLRLEIDAPDAVVEVDGREEQGAGPIRTISLDPGSHAIGVRAPGREPVTRQVSLLSGETATERIALPASRATRLVITSASDDARIEVDGELAGMGRAEQRVAPGAHLVRVIMADGTSTEREVDVAAGQTLAIELSAERGAGIETQWWFWTILGVIAAGAVIGIVAGATYDPGVQAPIPGDVGPGGIVVALTF